LEKRKHRLLIIEDNKEMSSLLKDFFEEEGFQVDSVDDGRGAFPKLTRMTFDLIITDIWMAGLSGLDILPAMKKINPRIPVIVITAFGSEEMRRRAMVRGADAYLEKPLQLEKLKNLTYQMILPERMES
jgi:DNA-binding NtrC family response regulator